jgi:signal transduction histidine kinase/ligand-binding sensor domain-containing protein
MTLESTGKPRDENIWLRVADADSSPSGVSKTENTAICDNPRVTPLGYSRSTHRSGCVVRDKPRFRKTLIGVLILQAWLVSQALALDPRASSYLRSDFNVEQGLPDNEVNAITQTRNGFLWVGTDGGLARFDGEHFTQIRLRTGKSKEIPISFLLTAQDGALWVGTDAGLAYIPSAALDHFDRSLVTMYHPGLGPSDRIACLLIRDGILWVGTSHGLYRFERGHFVTVIPDEPISTMDQTSDGHLLIITAHEFVEWDGARILRYPELPRQLGVHSDGIFQVHEDRNRVRWFCTSSGVARLVNGSFQKLPPYGNFAESGAFRIYEDPQGNLWTNKESGLFRVSATHAEDLALGVHARYMYSDRNGTLWVATSSEGLLRFTDRTFRMYTAADGLPASNIPMAVLATHDGTLWVGSNCGGLSRFDGERFKTYREKDGLLNSCVWSLAEDANRDLWIGTWGGGLFRFRNGRFTQYSTPQGLPSPVVLSLAAAQDGSLWIATTNGLSHLQNEHLHNYAKADGLSNDRIITVFQDRGGGIWAATDEGVNHLVDDHFEPVRGAPEEGEVPYGPLKEDSFGNLYAFSLLNGISRIEDNRLISVNHALQPSGMVESPDHDFWFSGRDGIYRVAASNLKQAEMDHDSPLAYTSFSRADGLNSRECTGGQPNIAITPDDKLWVGTLKGLAMLDLRRQLKKNQKPAIFMEDIEVGKARTNPGRELILEPGKAHVALHFTAVDLASPENVRIQYRLDDVDTAWFDADSTRTATYTDIPVGVHAFHIRASNGDGVWDREGIVYNVTQQPFFYQTMTFRVASLIAGALLLVGLYQLRLRQAAARLNARLEERLLERERIARDLHDTLLQGFQGLILRFHDAMTMIPESEPARQRMEASLDRADEVMAEGRDRVVNLHASFDNSGDLPQSLARAGDEITSGSEVKVCVTAEGQVQTLDPVAWDEIFCIGREAMVNAFRHAKGSRIEVEIDYASWELRLRIRDDGQGINPEILRAGRPGHIGLAAMRERADKVGGQLNINSGPGAGTEIELIVPASRAYRGVLYETPWRRLWNAVLGGH